MKKIENSVELTGISTAVGFLLNHLNIPALAPYCFKWAYLLQHKDLRSPGMELAGECGAGDIATGFAGPKFPEGAPSRGQPLHCIPQGVCSVSAPTAADWELNVAYVLFPQMTFLCLLSAAPAPA